MYGFRRWSGLLVLAVATAGCSSSDEPEKSEKPQVYTTFYPTTYFVRRIGGDRVEVVCPLPADADPIFWKPDEATIAAYQKADLIVINGARFEKWVGKVSLPSSKIVDTAKPLEKDWLKFRIASTHSHGPGEHSHEGTDGHTWLDPNHAKVQAEEIHKALARLLPDHAAEFKTNCDALSGDLDKLDAALKELSSTLGEQHLLASHPAYNYLVERYDWNVTNLDLDPEAMPDEKTMADIRQLLEQFPARIILWEAQPRKDIAERFQQELNLTSVEFSPCELLGDEEIKSGVDYFSVMKDNVARLKAALSK